MSAQERLRELILREHPRQLDTRCRARRKPPEDKKPGPSSPPQFCCLPEGHQGPHKHNNGGASFAREIQGEIEIGEHGNGWCTSCRQAWPCQMVEKMEAVLAEELPAVKIDPGTGLSMPRIVCSAMQFSYLNQRNVVETVVIPSARHYDGSVHALVDKLINGDRRRKAGEVQGFIDQHGKFYTRQEAWVIAERNGQIRRRVGNDGPDGMGLNSENLY